MFKLPVCPHCGTVYRYADTKKAMKQKENTCYHCKKRFRASLIPFVLIEAAVLAAVGVVINIFILSRMKELNLFPLFAVALAVLLLIYILYPFFLRFRKVGEENETDKKSKTKKETKK